MTVDRVAQIVSRLPQQYAELPGWAGFLTDIGEEFQALEDVHQDLLTLRSLPTATGAQLETLGNLVGEAPTGLADDVYRRRIQARIATNRSRGTTDDLIRIARLVLTDDVTTPTVTIVNRPPAAVFVHIAGATVEQTVATELIKFLRAAVRGGGAAGVQIFLETSEYPPEERFCFLGGTGLGFGTAARLDLAPLTANCETVVRARVPGTGAVDGAGNNLTLRLVHSGGAPPGGLLTAFHDAFTFTFVGGTTTVAQFEAAINASTVLHVLTSDGVGTLTATVDEFAATPFTGGIDGGRFSGMRI